MKRFEPHPVAELLPYMSVDEEHELAVDIKRHGLRTPVVLFEGQILDGRHRARVWFKHHNNHDNMPTVRFTGTVAEAVAFVRSQNVKRRHLKRSQIAYFEAQVEAFMKPQRTGGDRRSAKARSDHGGISPMISQRQIAAAAGVDRKTIRKAAKAVKNSSPIVAARLRDGKISVDRALAISRMPREQQATAAMAVGQRRPRLEVVASLDLETLAFNRGIEAAAQLVDDEGYDALAHSIRELKE